MAHEIETKVLDIDKEKVIEKLISLGAQKIQETRLVVDWYRFEGIKEGEDPWFLRIRSNSEEKYAHQEKDLHQHRRQVEVEVVRQQAGDPVRQVLVPLRRRLAVVAAPLP